MPSSHGVGKCTVTWNLAMALTLPGKKVGQLDVDFHGPGIPTMLSLEDRTIKEGEGRVESGVDALCAGWE